MYILFSLIPATFLIVVGYFVFFSTTKTDGAVKTFGQLLAIWIFIMAGILPVAGAYATYAGFPSMGAMMRSMHHEEAPKVR